MRKNRIFQNQAPLKTIDKNPSTMQPSKFSLESNLKSNAHFSIIDNLLLRDLMDRNVRDSNFGQVIRLAYISSSNEVHIDEQALYILQRFTSSEVAFVGIYGRRGSGKSLFFDKILNLAGVEGSHYCRTSENYEKGLYFYSLPFIKSNNLNVFLIDCVGFELNRQNQSTRQEDMLLDLMMVLCSSLIVLPPVDDYKGDSFKTIYTRIQASTQRITENKVSTTPEKNYWPRNVYCLLRKKQQISSCYEDLQKLFLNYSYTIIYDALPQKLKAKGITDEDLVEIQAIPEKNMDGLHIDGQYIKNASRLMREVIDKVYNKKYCELNFNGNIVCKLLLTVIKHLNKKERIKIDKICFSILKELFESAYQYHVEFYDQKLQEYFVKDSGFPLDYLMIAFQSCRESIMTSFNKLKTNNSIHEEYEKMLEKYIDEKEQLILEINKKKTKFYLKTKLKDQIRHPKHFTDKGQIFQFIQSLQNLEHQLDHNRCTIFSNILILFANDLQQKYLEDAIRKQQIIIEELREKIEKRKAVLEKDKQQNMKNIILNTENLNKYQNLLKQNQSLDFRIKNTKKQIDIEKKFQKQFMENKEATKQHAERLLTFIRELQEKTRDNDQVIDGINKEFQYNPTIEILNKRIEEKIRQQKDIKGGRGDSQISHKNFKRRSQVRTIISGSNISGVKPSSTINGQ